MPAPEGLYTNIPPWQEVRLPTGKLYFFDSSLDSNPNFRTDLTTALSKTNPQHLGLQLGWGVRSDLGFIREFAINNTTTVVLKRSFNERGDFVNRYRDDEYYARTYRLKSYYDEMDAYFYAINTYRNLASEMPNSLGDKFLVEECAGIFIGKDGQYWQIYKYYPIEKPPFRKAARALYHSAYDKAHQQAVWLQNNSDLVFNDIQIIVTRDDDGNYEGRIIDLERISYTGRVHRENVG